MEYEKFKVVEKGLTSPPRKTTLAKPAMRETLSEKKDHGPAYKVLKAERYFLKSAIETVYRSKPLRASIPFRVYADYRRKSSSRRAADLLLQEDEAL